MSIDVMQDANGIWFARPFLGISIDGKQIRPYRSFPDAATRAQAQQMANDWESALSADGQVRSLKIRDMLKDYREDRLAKDIADTTATRWKQFEEYVAAYLPNKTVDELTVVDLSNFESKLLLPKEKKGQGLSRNSVRGVHYYLRGAFKRWVRAGIISSNPMFYVQEPKLEKHEAVALDECDFEILSKAIAKDLKPSMIVAETYRQAVYAFACWLSLHTATRVGEVCALRRRDVSKRDGYVHVGGNVIQPPGGGAVRVDKTKGHISRNVSLTDEELAVIVDFQRLQDSVFLEELPPAAPLVTMDGTSFMRPDTVSRAFSRMRDRLGLPKECHFHSLRHTHATWCLAAGVDLKTLSERLGHADEATTLHTYAHAMKGRDQAAAKAFNDLASRLGGVSME